MSRLAALAILALALLLGSGLAYPGEKPRSTLPVTGKVDAKFARLDKVMIDFLDKHHLPGATLAVAEKGERVYLRGFGYADRDAKLAMQPDALFRVSSISKPITAVAILRLVEAGQLDLDAKVFDLLGLRAPTKGFDDRWKQITVRHLLHHRSGWDHRTKRDPMYYSPLIVREMGTTHPAMPDTIIRYMLRQPLHHEPGSKVAYSNFGYLLLGRVIEKVSKQKYETFVKKNVFEPLGITRARLGRSLAEFRAPGEVKYYSTNRAPAVLGPGFGKPAMGPYGTFCLEAMDAHAGWLMSAPDLLTFICAFGDPKKSKLLSEETVETMFARADGEDLKNLIYFGKGWIVRDFGMKRRAFWHDGSLDGSSTMVVYRADHYAFAVLVNSREEVEKTEPVGALELPIHEAINAIFGGK